VDGVGGGAATWGVGRGYRGRGPGARPLGRRGPRRLRCFLRRCLGRRLRAAGGAPRGGGGGPPGPEDPTLPGAIGPTIVAMPDFRRLRIHPLGCGSHLFLGSGGAKRPSPGARAPRSKAATTGSVPAGEPWRRKKGDPRAFARSPMTAVEEHESSHLRAQRHFFSV